MPPPMAARPPPWGSYLSERSELQEDDVETRLVVRQTLAYIF